MSLQNFLFILFNLLVAASCGDEKNLQVETQKEINFENGAWVDSVMAEMDDREKYYQHLIIEIPNYYQVKKDSVISWITSNKPGGVYLKNWHLDTIQQISLAFDTLPLIRPYFYFNYFEEIGAEPYPFWNSNIQLLDENFIQFFAESDFKMVNYTLPIELNSETKKWLDTLSLKMGVQPIVSNFKDKNVSEEYLNFTQQISNEDYPVMIELSHFDTVNFKLLKDNHSYQGLFVVKCKEQSVNECIANGADFVFKNIESADKFEGFNAINYDKELFDSNTRDLLLKKSISIHKTKRINAGSQVKYIQLNYQLHTTALLKNDDKLLPFKSKFSVYSSNDFLISQTIKKEHDFTVVKKKIDDHNLSEIIKSKGNKVVFLPDTLSEEMIGKIQETKSDDKVVFVFSNKSNFKALSTCKNLIYTPKMSEFDASIFCQQLDGSLPILADFYNDSLITCVKLDKRKLARTRPELCGMDSDTLKQIAWFIDNTISRKGTPGAQILIAKDGCIIYDRVFGKHTYTGNTLVSENSMYDLASITKVVSTTLMSMKLYEMGLYELNDSLNDYLPDSLRLHLRFPSTIRNITFQEILTHTSGLPSGFPIIKYMQYTGPNVGRYDRFFCDRKDSCYAIEVAENFFLEIEQQDSMWLRMNQIYLDPSKPYKYSDVNMNLMYFMLKSFIDNQPDKFGFTQPKKQLKDKNLYVEYLYKTFYIPLGMNHTTYLPIKKFSRDNIVPTENETYWRKQLLHGYVHDPNAALHGGIAGNAGIFSTTNDLVKLFQMWLNKGVYNGQRFLKAETVDKFTSRQENCFRGLGFNKPSMGSTSFGMSENASLSTYGHTGFTGTCFWIDPEHDLIYIYLSNAVHPSVNNKDNELGIRKKIHQCAYDAMMLKDF